MTTSLDTAKAKLTVMSRTLSPEEISRRVGLAWDDARRVGDRKGRSQQVWEVNLWQLYETSECIQDTSSVSLALDECLGRLRKRLSNAMSAIHALSQSETVELGLYMLAENVPPIHLNADALSFIHELGVELDIDVVLCGE